MVETLEIGPERNHVICDDDRRYLELPRPTRRHSTYQLAMATERLGRVMRNSHGLRAFVPTRDVRRVPARECKE